MRDHEIWHSRLDSVAIGALWGDQAGRKVTDAFQRNEKSPGNPSVYISGDGHPSIAGHALIAEEIVRTIQQERLLDR